MDKKRVDPGKVSAGIGTQLKLPYLLYGEDLVPGSVVIAESDLCCKNVAETSPFSRLHILPCPCAHECVSTSWHFTCTAVLGTRRGSNGYIATGTNTLLSWMCAIGFPVWLLVIAVVSLS